MTDINYGTPAAGRLTSHQSITSEPSFIRKKKEKGHGDRRTHTTEHDADLVCNLGLLFIKYHTVMF